jgi:hypothetical protein
VNAKRGSEIHQIAENVMRMFRAPATSWRADRKCEVVLDSIRRSGGGSCDLTDAPDDAVAAELRAWLRRLGRTLLGLRASGVLGRRRR